MGRYEFKDLYSKNQHLLADIKVLYNSFQTKFYLLSGKQRGALKTVCQMIMFRVF